MIRYVLRKLKCAVGLHEWTTRFHPHLFNTQPRQQWGLVVYCVHCHAVHPEHIVGH